WRDSFAVNEDQPELSSPKCAAGEELRPARAGDHPIAPTAARWGPPGEMSGLTSPGRGSAAGGKSRSETGFRCVGGDLARGLAACGQIMAPTTAAPASASYTAQFDAVWNTFDQQYPYFEQKKVDWNAMRARYRPAAIAATSEAELAAVLRDMLGTLDDRHVV